MPNPSTRRVGYSSLVYDERVARYRGESGRFMGAKAVRAVIDADIEDRAMRLQKLGTSLASGIIDVKQWRDAMRDEVKAIHLAHGAAGKGGFHNMDRAAYGTVGQRLRFHYEHLNGFAQDVTAGKYRNADGTLNIEAINARAAMYAQAGRNTFERIRSGENARAGFQFVESELESGAHHCEGRNSCVAMANKRRVVINEMLMPGDRACQTKCKCTLNYFQSMT